MKRTGEETFKKLDKVNAELFTLTYGAMVMQLIKDHETVEEVNNQLEKMGYNIGVRIIEEFLAKSGVPCIQKGNIRESADLIAKHGFKMFLGVTAQIRNWNSDGNEFTIALEDNPLIDFVELPNEYKDLWYSNILCGVIKGALEMVQMTVDCKQIRCPLKGDDCTEIRVYYKGTREDEMPSQGG